MIVKSDQKHKEVVEMRHRRQVLSTFKGLLDFGAGDEPANAALITAQHRQASPQSS
jgi:hypothetical protein